jgi:hypothetical protein
MSHEAVKARLVAVGFSFHSLADSRGNRAVAPDHVGKHWWCWKGPDNAWDVESGDSKDDEESAVIDALDAFMKYVAGVREAIFAKAADEEPPFEEYDDTESAFENGLECGLWECARIVREGGK